MTAAVLSLDIPLAVVVHRHLAARMRSMAGIYVLATLGDNASATFPSLKSTNDAEAILRACGFAIRRTRDFSYHLHVSRPRDTDPCDLVDLDRGASAPEAVLVGTLVIDGDES